MKGPVQDDSGVVAGEWPPGAIGAMLSRRETDDQQPVSGASEWRDRAAMISGVPLADLVEVSRQPFTTPAAGIELRALAHRKAAQRTLNCASSVEPFIAVMEELPAVIV
jgi:hypothetical protein